MRTRVRFKVIVFLIAALLIMPHGGSYTKGIVQKSYLRKIDAIFVLETLTIYNPEVSQCDATPFITSSNARIDPAKLQKQEIRWMALSRDLLKRWNGVFNYGDTLMVRSGDGEIDGLWVVQDILNKKFKNRGDLLFDSSVRKTGKWNNVTITHSVIIRPTDTGNI